MRISCVTAARELDAVSTDLIVFPEGVCQEEIQQAQSSHRDAVIVGAVVESGIVRGVLQFRGLNLIHYRKIGTDGRTTGTGDHNQNPVYELRGMCIGVLICMDIQDPFSTTVIDNIKSSSANLKLLCIPADMASASGFDISKFPERFEGIYVIFCNHTKTHKDEDRCKSFIMNTHGKNVAPQSHGEPIHADLP